MLSDHACDACPSWMVKIRSSKIIEMWKMNTRTHFRSVKCGVCIELLWSESGVLVGNVKFTWLCMILLLSMSWCMMHDTWCMTHDEWWWWKLLISSISGLSSLWGIWNTASKVMASSYSNSHSITILRRWRQALITGVQPGFRWCRICWFGWSGERSGILL